MSDNSENHTPVNTPPEASLSNVIPLKVSEGISPPMPIKEVMANIVLDAIIAKSTLKKQKAKNPNIIDLEDYK